MADNKTYTLESAKELFAGDNWDKAVDEMSLEEMMSLDNAIYGQPIAEGVDNEALFVRQEAQKRIEALLAKDTLSPDELDSIAAFVTQFASHTVKGESIYANDPAKKLMARVEAQRKELAEGKTAASNTAESKTDEGDTFDIEVSEEKDGEEKVDENTAEDTAEKEAGGTTQIDEVQGNGEEREIGMEDFEKNNEEELTFPEGEPAKEMSDKEYAEMLDPLSADMPEMTKEEKARQAERLNAVMVLDAENPYTPEDSINTTLDFTVEQTAIRRLTIGQQDITKENLDTAREAEQERVTIEYYNAVFGVCKTDEELDKETPAQHIERLGKVAHLVSQKRPKEEIYAAMGIKPTPEQETIASNAVYRTNAEPALSWAKELGKSGLAFMDKYRAFEQNNPTLSMGLSLVATGNPLYKGARMALAARGLYKDYEAYKAKHPNEKVSFLGMLKDKEARKSLAANASIFIRSVPVVGQGYSLYGMAKQLHNTCKKDFWKDLGGKFKDAGKSIVEVAKNPKDKSKWKDAFKKVQVPLAITGGLALTAYAAYKGIEHYNATHNDTPVDGVTGESVRADAQPEANMEELQEKFGPKGNFFDKDGDGKIDMFQDGQEQDDQAESFIKDRDGDGIADDIDPDHGQGWANANETQLNRAFDADPRGINAILNDGKFHSSAELHHMMENGEFSDDQLKAIHSLASREFDENGHIIDQDLNKLYEDLAKQARANQHVDQSHDEPQITPQGEVRSPADQQAYEAILSTISKGENMDDPEVRASVEKLAAMQLKDVKEALAAGDEQKAINIMKGVHDQGEEAEVRAATQKEDDDSRGVRHAKAKLDKTYNKLEDAKARLAEDPDNAKLQKEVAKLEKEFDKRSIKLDNKEIKQEDKELKHDIKEAKHDLKHTTDAQTQEELKARMAANEERREALKEQKAENKVAYKSVKHGNGFSTDEETNLKFQEKLPGQSEFINSNAAAALVEVNKEVEANAQKVDAFLKVQVARGTFTQEQAAELRQGLIDRANGVEPQQPTATHTPPTQHQELTAAQLQALHNARGNNGK